MRYYGWSTGSWPIFHGVDLDVFFWQAYKLHQTDYSKVKALLHPIHLCWLHADNVLSLNLWYACTMFTENVVLFITLDLNIQIWSVDIQNYRIRAWETWFMFMVPHILISGHTRMITSFWWSKVLSKLLTAFELKFVSSCYNSIYQGWSTFFRCVYDKWNDSSFYSCFLFLFVGKQWVLKKVFTFLNVIRILFLTQDKIH